MTEISLYRRCPDAPPFRLLISDMDSTIIEQECLDELADFAGFKPRVAAITEAAMRGEIEFESALKERVALLEGMEAAVLETVFRERITLVPGATEMIASALAKGMLTVLVSGGLPISLRASPPLPVLSTITATRWKSLMATSLAG